MSTRQGCQLILEPASISMINHDKRVCSQLNDSNQVDTDDNTAWPSKADIRSEDIRGRLTISRPPVWHRPHDRLNSSPRSHRDSPVNPWSQSCRLWNHTSKVPKPCGSMDDIPVILLLESCGHYHLPPKRCPKMNWTRFYNYLAFISIRPLPVPEIN
ncbi:hypothetical protein J6590_081713 [Homalodisca vitripennis]|nr:hypothetical protein J6590_081713 [Homalodisca vitripennis]